MMPKVTVDAYVEMVEIALFDGKRRVASAQAAVDCAVKMDALRPNGGIPMIEIRFNDPEAALRIGWAGLDLWRKWRETEDRE